jgi:hypothetical protein
MRKRDGEAALECEGRATLQLTTHDHTSSCVDPMNLKDRCHEHV